MNLNFKEIISKEVWENFLLSCQEKTFLQSWNWGEFQIKEGNQIWRFGIFFDEKLIGVCLVISIAAKRGTFLFIPHGPVLMGGLSQKDTKEIFQALVEKLQEIAKEKGASFIRFSPILENTQENDDIFSELDFRNAPLHMHPEITWELDITGEEKTILSGMRKTTRYLVRQADKNPDIAIETSSNIQDLQMFQQVYQETAARQHFSAFSLQYLQNEFEVFSKDGEIMMLFGKYKGEVIAAALFVFWQGTCFYHHSGSILKYKNVPVMYLLQWEAIKEAKKRGLTTYNFWGIAPGVTTEKDAAKSKHPWAGLSLFKMGFGGYKKEYVATKDLPLSKKYWINYIIESIRKRKRRL